MAIFSNTSYENVVVHDLRTPLNVIQLAIRMLEDSPAIRDTETAEDLHMIRANAQELEHMLIHLIDFSRLPELPSELVLDTFDPRRLLEEVLEEYRSRHPRVIELDAANAPSQVTLDHSRTQMAFKKVLANVAGAAMGTSVHVRLGGEPDRCVASFRVGVPPRDSVWTHEVDPDHFERIIGTPAERRGLDLSIAAKISKLFGGMLRLEAVPGQGTTAVLDWPSRVERDS